jgi:hypothetical protein
MVKCGLGQLLGILFFRLYSGIRTAINDNRLIGIDFDPTQNHIGIESRDWRLHLPRR